jgi:hypothetical protein
MEGVITVIKISTVVSSRRISITTKITNLKASIIMREITSLRLTEKS